MSGAAVDGQEGFAGQRRAGQRTDDARLAVLVVEQRRDVVRGLVEAVVGQPIVLDTCDDAAGALLRLGRLRPDVVVLGPVAGRLDPIDFIRIALSDDPNLPILAGAGSDSSQFAAGASAAGATAVIQRPYRGPELLAMLRSLAPHTKNLQLRPPPIDLGRIRVDGAVPQAWVDGKQISVPPMEFVLLRYFAERVGQVISRAELVDAVWGEDQQSNSNTLTVHIMRLRKRLGGDGVDWIKSVRGLGYQFTVPGAGEVPEPR